MGFVLNRPRLRSRARRVRFYTKCDDFILKMTIVYSHNDEFIMKNDSFILKGTVHCGWGGYNNGNEIVTTVGKPSE